MSGDLRIVFPARWRASPSLSTRLNPCSRTHGFTAWTARFHRIRYRNLPQQTGLHRRIFCGPGTGIGPALISGARLPISSRLPILTLLTGLTDLKRLQKGYLRYTGMLRTPVATLISSVRLDGIETPVSTEYFASTADVHLVLNHISPADYVCDTADKKEKTRASALRSLPGWSAPILRKSVSRAPCRSRNSAGIANGRSSVTRCGR